MGYSDSQTEEFLDQYEEMLGLLKGNNHSEGFGE